MHPKHQCPAEQDGRQDSHHRGMEQTQFLEVAQAARPGAHLLVHAIGEALRLAAERGKSAHQRSIADNVDEFALDRRRLDGVGAMEAVATRSDANQHCAQREADGHEDDAHQRIDRGKQRDGAGYRDRRWQGMPCDAAFDLVDRLSGGGDTAGQHSGATIGEIGRRVPEQILKQIAANIPGHRHETPRGHPAARPPAHVVSGDQAAQHNKSRQHRLAIAT